MYIPEPKTLNPEVLGGSLTLSKIGLVLTLTALGLRARWLYTISP